MFLNNSEKIALHFCRVVVLHEKRLKSQRGRGQTPMSQHCIHCPEQGAARLQNEIAPEKCLHPCENPASPSVTFGVSFFAVFLGYSLCTEEEEFYCLQGRSEGLSGK